VIILSVIYIITHSLIEMISRDREIERGKEIRRIKYSEKKIVCASVCAHTRVRSVFYNIECIHKERDTNEADNMNKRKRVYDRKHTSQLTGYVRSQVCLTACHKS
jgi:hypothetical protein